jgi:putative transcriptional regulator
MSASPPVPSELLLDYATGACSDALELLIATHLAMSEESRTLCRMLEDVGGALLETLEDQPLERLTALSVLEAIDPDSGALALAGAGRGQGVAPERPRPAKFGGDTPPAPLLAYAGEFAEERAWQRLGWSAAVVRLSASSAKERVHLLWARPGTEIATHRHVGREVVLVLKGAFWDEGLRYGPGDIAVGEDGTVHAPRIDGEADCVCLAITEAPVHFVGPFGWALNRLCRF